MTSVLSFQVLLVTDGTAISEWIIMIIIGK